ncbi:MAG: serine hydrolase, partial [FCB group bacterium]|nr:serine hydrolase [FCB group bacterium]
IEKGELSLDSTLIFHRETINYPWKNDDAIARFAEGEDISIGKLLAYSITFSDNYASIWLQQLAGTGTAINAWLDLNGWNQTRVNSRTVGRESDWEQYGWGQSTPREMTRFLVRIRNGDVVSPRASEDMYRYLTRIYWDGTALSQIPPTVQTASKQGAVDEARSEVVLVNAPHGDYVFCVMTNHQTDQSWNNHNEGFVLLRAVSKLLWETFEPESTWHPAEGIEEFRK